MELLLHRGDLIEITLYVGLFVSFKGSRRNSAGQLACCPPPSPVQE
jgi:hypothetical protein